MLVAVRTVLVQFHARLQIQVVLNTGLKVDVLVFYYLHPSLSFLSFTLIHGLQQLAKVVELYQLYFVQ